jgi:type IV pilus assembly protein PilY1
MPMNRLLKRVLPVLALLFAAQPVLADDIDIFASTGIEGENPPHVLFVMDTGASFSANNNTFRCAITAAGAVITDGSASAADYTALDKTNGAVEQCAIYAAVKAIAEAGVNVKLGVMLFNNQQKNYNPVTNTFSENCIGSGGGCLAMPFTNLAENKDNILAWIKSWTTSGNNNWNIKSPANRGDGASMQEAWAVFFGKKGMSGRTYADISASCGGKYVVFIGNAYDNQASPKDTTNDELSPLKALAGTSSDTAKRASPAATDEEKAQITDTYSSMVCGNTTKSGTVTTDEGKGAYALNWANYLNNRGVVTYSVGLTGSTCDATYVANLTKLGSTEVGGGRYFGTTNYAELVAALKTIFSEIAAVNSAFASAALPASVNTQGLYLNQVFIGMFRPATNFLPRWNGNLKQYKMGLVSNDLELQDAADTNAINSQTGFITECARSFWTPASTDTYWSSTPLGECLTEGAKASNSPDGNVVEKGAQAYSLRAMTPGDRRVWTWTCGAGSGSCSTLSAFTTGGLSGVSASLFGAGSDTDKNTLINWARGLNVDDELNKGTTVMRPSAHGDVVHSRPVAVNHGTDDAPSIVVYYGGNDGMLRAVNGNRTADVTSNSVTYPAGSELWSFVPYEFYGKFSRLRTNTAAVYRPGPNSGTPKDYGMDGPITAFQGTVGGSAKTYIYATMRRGGRSIYAFDVTTPGAPAMLWRKGCSGLTSDTDCSSGNDEYKKIGQTWASLKSFYANGYGSGTSPMMIMGGGYDACEDYDAKVANGKNHNCVSGGGGTDTGASTTITKGNRIFVFDATDGSIVKSFKTKRAVVADVALVRDANGKATYGYTADLGGYVYRLDFTNGDKDNWSITTIASLGCDDPTTCTDSAANRKFMFAPSVLATAAGEYTLLLGSGDREKPVHQYAASKSVTNYFFKLVDKPTDGNWLNLSATCGANYICRAKLLGITTSANPSASDLTNNPYGWYLGLSATEQVVTQAITIFGITTFSTHQPTTGDGGDGCKPDLGSTRVYNISYKDASASGGARYGDVSGDGLPPSPIGGRVKLDDGTIVPFCMGCSTSSPEAPKKKTAESSVSQPRGRLYWYIEK